MIFFIFPDRTFNPFNPTRQLKLYPKYKFENIDYLSVYLIMTEYGDEDRTPGRIVKARFRISILRSDGLPAKQMGLSRPY